MSVDAQLAERARRHGLVREEEDVTPGWSRPEDRFYFVAQTGAGWWWWAPAGVTNSEIERGPRYLTEEAALTAALHYLDHTVPSRAWSPSVGGQLAEAVGMLREAVAHLENTAPAGRSLLAHDAADKALRLLQSLALPSGADEGAVLAVAWDYLCERGALPEIALGTLVAAVRHHPEVVGLARLAVWYRDEDCDQGTCLLLPPLRVSSHDWIGRVHLAHRSEDTWRWEIDADLSGRIGDSGHTDSREEAQAECVRRLTGWRVLETTEAPEAAEAAPLRVQTVTAHVWVPTNSGAGWHACASPGCQRYRTALYRYVTARDVDHASRLTIVGDSALDAGPCPARLP